MRVTPRNDFLSNRYLAAAAWAEEGLREEKITFLSSLPSVLFVPAADWEYALHLSDSIRLALSVGTSQESCTDQTFRLSKRQGVSVDKAQT